MGVAERWDATKRAQACYICLGPGHTASECKVVNKICGCRGCTLMHSIWLHRPDKRGGEERIVVTYNSDIGNKHVKTDLAEL